MLNDQTILASGSKNRNFKYRNSDFQMGKKLVRIQVRVSGCCDTVDSTLALECVSKAAGPG